MVISKRINFTELHREDTEIKREKFCKEVTIKKRITKTGYAFLYEIFSIKIYTSEVSDFSVFSSGSSVSSASS